MSTAETSVCLSTTGEQQAFLYNESVLLKEYEQAISLSKESGFAVRQNVAMFVALCSAVAIAIANEKEINQIIELILLTIVGTTGVILTNSIYRNNSRNRIYMRRAREIEKLLGMRLITNGNTATKQLCINISNRMLVIFSVGLGSMLIIIGVLVYLFRLLLSAF
ncbi:MAG: hypothetical protein U1E33_08940 [Rhodospirillales bacterium]